MRKPPIWIQVGIFLAACRVTSGSDGGIDGRSIGDRLGGIREISPSVSPSNRNPFGHLRRGTEAGPDLKK